MKDFKKRVASSRAALQVTFWWFIFLNWILKTVVRRNSPVPRAYTLAEAERRVADLTYSPDIVSIGDLNIRHGFMGSAEWVQWFLDRGRVPQTDCDEFALYAMEILGGVPNVYIPRLLTIRWQMPDGSIGGHNTCVFEYVKPHNPDTRLNSWFSFATLCNWGLEKDYKTLDEVVRSFPEAFGGKLICYALSNKKLKILRHVKT